MKQNVVKIVSLEFKPERKMRRADQNNFVMNQRIAIA